jgi:hypothetical protein
MKNRSTFRNFSALVALGLVMATAPSTISAQSTDSEQVSKLLSQARSEALLAGEDAATLESYVRSNSHWKSHVVKLESMKAHINELGKLDKQLCNLRTESSPWQQKAIDQIDARIREIASHLNTTINHLNENQARVRMRPYREYVQDSLEMTSNLAKLIDDYVDYDEAKSQAESLEQRLELPVAASGM